MITKTVKDQNGKELTNADVDRILKGDHIDELRDKIYKYLDCYYYEVLGNGKGNDANIITDYIMQLIQAERTKAKEEVISRLQTWWLKGTEYEPFSAVIDELKQSLEKGTDE